MREKILDQFSADSWRKVEIWIFWVVLMIFKIYKKSILINQYIIATCQELRVGFVALQCFQ